MHLVKRAAVVAGMTFFLLAGCDSAEDPGPETSETTSTTAATSPEETVATTSAPAETALEDEGQQDAADAVVGFWAMLDELSQDPSTPVEELGRFARGQAVKQWISIIEDQRDRDSVQTGDTVVTVTDVKTIEEGQRYEVTVCLDFSTVKFDGETPDRQFEDGAQITYVLRPVALSEGELFVTDDPLEYEPCGS